MPLITMKKQPGKIRYAVEKLIDGKRFLQIRREHWEDQTITDEWVPMEASDRPLMCILNVDGDIDESYLKDIVQSVVSRRAARRLTKPNITLLYHEFNEMRAAEFKGQRQFAMNTKKGTDGNATG